MKTTIAALLFLGLVGCGGSEGVEATTSGGNSPVYCQPGYTLSGGHCFAQNETSGGTSGGATGGTSGGTTGGTTTGDGYGCSLAACEGACDKTETDCEAYNVVNCQAACSGITNAYDLANCQGQCNQANGAAVAACQAAKTTCLTTCASCC